MPRLARIVWPRAPHHITQRGNRREQVFFTDEDRRAYLAWLKDYAEEDYLWAAVRYVERNPVRAKIVRKAENYRWSSTSAHCGGKRPALRFGEIYPETGEVNRPSVTVPATGTTEEGE